MYLQIRKMLSEECIMLIMEYTNLKSEVDINPQIIKSILQPQIIISLNLDSILPQMSTHW